MSEQTSCPLLAVVLDISGRLAARVAFVAGVPWCRTIAGSTGVGIVSTGSYDRFPNIGNMLPASSYLAPQGLCLREENNWQPCATLTYSGKMFLLTLTTVASKIVTNSPVSIL